MGTAPARLRLAFGIVASVLVVGTVGYWLLGFSFLDALYQTVTTITTVGFREVGEFGTAEKMFTIAVIIAGVGAVLYTFTLSVQLVAEGWLSDYVGRRRMDRKIADLHGHVVVCGWGRVGRAVADHLHGRGRDVVVVDLQRERVEGIALPTVVGDATLNDTLLAAGIERAQALIAALSGDADNLFVTLSGRAINPGPVHRRPSPAGRQRPQALPGRRRPCRQPPGARWRADGLLRRAAQRRRVRRRRDARALDGVPHAGDRDHRPLRRSPGMSLRELNLRERANVLVLAVRHADGTFVTNPDPASTLAPHQVIIAVGTASDLQRLEQLSE